MDRAGLAVLSKIENLLTQIDTNRQRDRPLVKPLQPQIPVVPQQSRLYDLHKQYELKRQQREKEELKKGVSEVHDFKVVNKRSLFFNSKQDRLPLYKRAAATVFEKELRLSQIRQKKYEDKQNEDRRQRECFMVNVTRTAAEINQQVRLREERVKLKEKQMQELRLSHLKESLKEVRSKPSLTKKTLALWGAQKMKRNLSPSVIKRFEKYEADRKENIKKYKAKYQQEVTPFTPNISKRSTAIVERLVVSRFERLMSPLNRSASCKCVQKHQRQQSPTMRTNRSQLRLKTDKQWEPPTTTRFDRSYNE